MPSLKYSFSLILFFLSFSAFELQAQKLEVVSSGETENTLTSSEWKNRFEHELKVIEKMMVSDPKAYSRLFSLSTVIKEQTLTTSNYLKSISIHMMSEAQGTTCVKLKDLKDPYNLVIPKRVLIEEGKGAEIKTTLKDFRLKLIEIAGMPNNDQSLPGLTPSGNVAPNGEKESWEDVNFNQLPLAAVVTNLDKMEADVFSNALEALKYCRAQAEKEMENN